MNKLALYGITVLEKVLMPSVDEKVPNRVYITDILCQHHYLLIRGK